MFVKAKYLQDYQGDVAGRSFARRWSSRRCLMRSLGRPNREQVVTTRPAEMTTLEAIEMSNGQPLAELLQRGSGAVAGRASELVEPRDVRLHLSNRDVAAADRRRTGAARRRLRAIR